MDPATFIDPNLTGPDLQILKNLLNDAESASPPREEKDSAAGARNRGKKSPKNGHQEPPSDEVTIQRLKALNNAQDPEFEPTVFVTWDMKDLDKLPKLAKDLLQRYIALARKTVRVETDVVMLTHLILYFSTSVPSAILLFRNFTWLHGIAHWIMQTYYVGTYTLMMHQHIHMGGILKKGLWWFDGLFPYITNPLMGHTWNSYYYHHVKHHHVEGNGPDDLSSTIRYQRDELFDFACYVGRFFFFIWLELPLYFFRKGKVNMAAKAAFWEIGNYVALVLLWEYVSWRATLCVFVLPLLQLRVGLMVGNWGQHAFVDEVDPNSDFRSSITLIDVPSNRFCYNDGYHTSHHLNPLRHWRDHPVSLLQQKERYAAEHALVFRNIDYIMITVRLMRKDYDYLARCLVPMGVQVGMSMEERAAMLRTKTKKFSEREVQAKFCRF
ncbi:fatty acid desaturase [Aspergillus undulatus]|uniref:fatty acid desaturase n=1 Tax=Aspergillus undulatus TaxID=1810928 RepID=UPI003CCDB30C